MFTTVKGHDGLHLIERIIDLNESNLDQVIGALNKHFLGTKNSLYKRFVFNGIVKKTDNSIRDFIGCLKSKHVQVILVIWLVWERQGLVHFSLRSTCCRSNQ